MIEMDQSRVCELPDLVQHKLDELLEPIMIPEPKYAPRGRLWGAGGGGAWNLLTGRFLPLKDAFGLAPL